MEVMRTGKVVPMGEETEELRVGCCGKVEQVSGQSGRDSVPGYWQVARLNSTRWSGEKGKRRANTSVVSCYRECSTETQIHFV